MKLIIVDGEPKIRRGLLKLLGAREGWQVSGVFEDAHSTLTVFCDRETDMVITDIKMPEVSGLELIRQIREQNRETRTAILGDHSNFAYAQKTIELGVVRYLLKLTNPRELVVALKGTEKESEPTREEEEQGGQIQGDITADNLADGDSVGNPLVWKAIQYVEVRYGGRIAFKDTSEELYLSPDHLYELFRRHMGKNLMEYVIEYRAVEVRTYLNRVGRRVSDVTEVVGCKGARHFSSTPKETHGITPLEYRNEK